jgi:uncharacterized protein YceH (UPF0502 family)
MGFKPWEFRRMTLVDFMDCVEAYNEQEEIEADRYRQMYCLIFNTNVEKKEHMITPEEYMPLPMDAAKLARIKALKPRGTITQEEQDKRNAFLNGG